MGKIADFFTSIFTAPSRERAKSVKTDLEKMNVPKKRLVAYGNTWMNGRNTMSGQQFIRGLPSTPNALELDHWSLRHNVRNMMFDSGPARGVVERFAQYEVNTGLRLRVKPNASLLGISQEEADAWGKDFSDKFNLHAESVKCSIDETQNLYMGQYFYSLSSHRDNDIFIRFHYSDDVNTMHPVRFQFIDPDQICGSEYTPTMWGAAPYVSNDDGIVRDSNGAETAYKVKTYDEKGRTKTVTVPKLTGDGLVNMIHAFKKEYAGQRRGFPPMSHAIQTFSNLTGFTIAQIQKAINQSNFAFYTKPSDDAPASNPLEDELDAQGPRPSDYIGSDPSNASEITEETVDDISMSLLSEFNVAQPGSVWVANLAKGEEVEPIENTAPADRYDSFVDSFVSHLCADVNMPVEMFLIKFGQNYSASRAVMVLFWRLLEIGQKEQIWFFLNPYVEMWANGMIANGLITAPGWSDPIIRAAYLQCTWIGVPMPEIDEFKAAKAAKERADLGHETLDDGAVKYNGSDGATNRAQLTREYEELPLGPWHQHSVLEEEEKSMMEDEENE